jgi:hypothetical protein
VWRQRGEKEEKSGGEKSERDRKEVQRGRDGENETRQ